MGCQSRRNTYKTYFLSTMILNLGSAIFNAETETGGGTPAWGTEMGQGEGYKFSFEDYANLITSLVYNSVADPQQRVTCPLGKGGKAFDDYEFVLCGHYTKVYVNGTLIPTAQFDLLVVKKLVGVNHVGRRTLKYNPRITIDGICSNAQCYELMAHTLGVSDEGSWFISEINTLNQDELHFTAHILDKDKKYIFKDSAHRSEVLSSFIDHDIFKQISKHSAQSDRTLDEALQQIFFGAPGTGKSHRINEVCAEYENYRTTFHPDTDYASFVGSYKPITEVVTKYDMHGHAYPEKRIVYTYVFQAFLKAYIAAWREQQKENPAPVFLVVEEINRGNCAQIFGDIFQLLDRNEAGYSDYPIVADDDLAQELRREFADLTVADAEGINALYRGGKDVVGSVKSGRQLLLPNNLYIWATMNTSDQSLFPIDSAFKRRWDWKYIKIKDSRKDYKIVFSNGNVYDWWSFVSEINRRIEGGEIQQEDKKLGYFFAKSRSGVITAERFLSKVIFYLYNDVFKDFGFDEDYFKGADGEPMTFASYFDEEGEADEAQIERFLKNLGLRPENITETDGAPSEETETEPGE